MTVQEEFHRAAEAHQKGRLIEANNGYLRVLAQQPKHADALHLMGVLKSQQGEHEEGVGYIEKAIQSNGLVPMYHVNYARSLLAINRLDLAVGSLQTAIQLDSTYKDAHFTLGNALKKLGRMEASIASFEKTLQLDPQHLLARFNLGNSYLATEAWDKAKACFEKVLQQAPEHPGALQNLAFVHSKFGES